MVVSDPIADMLTHIRNALTMGYPSVALPSSKMKVSIAKILKDEGFIGDYHLTDESPQSKLLINLKYVGERKDRHPVIRGMKRVSKPGRRVYTPASEIPWVRSGMGIAILTTSKGVLTGKQARGMGIGGEVLCYVW